MKRIAMAVILSFVCPGLGQIYNKDNRKGWIIIAASTLIFTAYLYWVMRVTLPRIQSTDPLDIYVTLKAVKAENAHTLMIFGYTMLGISAYSITEAYFKAKDIKSKETPPESQ